MRVGDKFKVEMQGGRFQIEIVEIHHSIAEVELRFAEFYIGTRHVGDKIAAVPMSWFDQPHRRISPINQTELFA